MTARRLHDGGDRKVVAGFGAADGEPADQIVLDVEHLGR